MANVRLLKSASSQCNSARRRDSDPVVVAAEACSAMRLTLDAMICEWQRLEDQLSHKARAIQISLTAACQSDMPEAKSLRTLDNRIAATHRKLVHRLWRVRQHKARTLWGAIAKVRLGLEAQHRCDWQENARELIEQGVNELHLLVEHGHPESKHMMKRS